MSLSDFDANPNDYQDEIFLFIHVTEDGSISNVPRNLSIHLHHNTSILDNLIISKPDDLS